MLGGLSEQANNFIDASIAWRDRKIKAKLATAKRLAKANEKARIEAEKRFELDEINTNVLELETKARRLAAQNSVEQGKDKLEQGKVKQAISIYKKAQAIDPKLEIDANYLHKLCQFASIDGQPQSVLSLRSHLCPAQKKVTK